MTGTVATTALYALLPGGMTIIGGVVALFWAPGARARSGIQHFVAGVIFSVAAVELLPEVVASHTPFEVAISFGLGVALMLGLQSILGRHKAEETPATAGAGRMPWAMLAAVDVDVFVDGLLLGVGFTFRANAGRLLALALALEGLSLGLATALTLMQAALNRGRTLAVITSVGLLFVVGGIAGAAVLSRFSSHVVSLVLAFALAALLFLVTEELLAEAHKTPDVPLVTALFFVGFVLFLILGMLE